MSKHNFLIIFAHISIRIIKLQENIARHGVTITQKDNDLMSAELKFAELMYNPIVLFS